MDEYTIETARLRIIAASREFLMADLVGIDRLCAALGSTPPTDWPPDGSGYDEAAKRFFLKMLSSGNDRTAGWYSWYVVLRSTNNQPSVLAGTAGFFGPPDDTGSVEIGFSVCKEWRNIGIATEAVESLVTYAWNNEAVNRILARTSQDNLASIHVLRKNRFQQIDSDEPETLQFERLGETRCFNT
jgi:RimJ/RimL family protein N-acetyltransferase